MKTQRRKNKQIKKTSKYEKKLALEEFLEHIDNLKSHLRENSFEKLVLDKILKEGLG